MLEAERIRLEPCGCHVDAPTGVLTAACERHGSPGDVPLRCRLCGHEARVAWTEVTWDRRCPRCTTGRLLRVDPRTAAREGVRPRNTRP